ncbi:MAG: SusD/RagB family nutrient-binding outer membrane lipoprotein [Cyclobacteriaceae bacterium]
MKKLMNIKLSLVMLIVLAVVPFACETAFDDLNKDPNNPTEANIDLIFAHGADNVLFKYGRFTNGSDWDMWAGLWTQAFAGNHASGVNYDQYVLRNPDALWGIWYDGFLDLQTVVQSGTESEDWTHVGAAQVITAVGLGSLTSFYGDLPWSEALQGAENRYPAFDTQEQVYQAIDDLLSEAVTNLQRTPAGGGNLAASDIWMGGDAQKWLGVAYALQARYANHMSIKDPAGSATAALSAVANAKAAGFTEAGADLTYPYSGIGNYQNGFYDMFENNQIIASENFIAALDATNDPRKIAIWNDFNFDGDFLGYIGKQNGFGTDNASYSPIGPRGYYGKPDSRQPIVTHFELLYIEAEAEMRLGNADAAATALNAAISAHMNLITPAAIETITGDGGDVTAYTDQIATYLSTYAAETGATVTMEKIMTQKHTAMVCMNGESWVDVRRHDHQFPSWLEIPRDNAGAPVASGFIKRVLYPQESINTNPSNTPTDVTIFDDLWLFSN